MAEGRAATTGGSKWAPRSRARRRVLQALYQWRMTGQEVNDILAQFLETQDFDTVDRDYFEALFRGVVREAGALTEALAPVMDRPMAQCDAMEHIVLLIGAWQLRHEPETPPQVVLDESADLANRFGSAQTHAYVNAVLDRAAHAWGCLAPAEPPPRDG